MRQSKPSKKIDRHQKLVFKDWKSHTGDRSIRLWTLAEIRPLYCRRVGLLHEQIDDIIGEYKTYMSPDWDHMKYWKVKQIPVEAYKCRLRKNDSAVYRTVWVSQSVGRNKEWGKNDIKVVCFFHLLLSHFCFIIMCIYYGLV